MTGEWTDPSVTPPPPPSINEWIRWGSEGASMLRLDDAAALVSVLQAAHGVFSTLPDEYRELVPTIEAMLDGLNQPYNIDAPFAPPLDRVVPFIEDRMAEVAEHVEACQACHRPKPIGETCPSCGGHGRA